MAERIYLDANALIEAVERTGPVADAIANLLDAAEALVTSEITLGEVLVWPLENGRAKTVSAYMTLIASRPGLDVIPIGREVLVRAAELRAEAKSMKLPDAIHVATAERSGCTRFLSNDQRIVLPGTMIRVPFDLALLRMLTGAR